MLCVISSPTGYPPLDVEHEWQKLTQALDEPIKANRLVLDRLAAPTLEALQRRLRRGAVHILHFVGHGGFDDQTQDGVLLLQDPTGKGNPVTGESLGVLLHDHDPLRLVVLNACEGARTSATDPFAGTAQSLVRKGIPAVIAMQFEITDEAAITMANEFYTAVSDGYPVDAALSEARKAIFTRVSAVEWATPVLFMRAPDGRIFALDEPAAPAVEEDAPPPAGGSEGPTKEQPGPPPVSGDGEATKRRAEPVSEPKPVPEPTPKPKPGPRRRLSPAALAAIVGGAAVVVVIVVVAILAGGGGDGGGGTEGTGGPTSNAAAVVPTEWTPAPSDDLGGPGTQSMAKAIPGGPGLIAVGKASNGTDTDAAIWTSSDGLTWDRVGESSLGVAGPEELFGIAEGNGTFVAVGEQGTGDARDAAVWTSSDAGTWTAANPDGLVGAGLQSINRVAWDGTTFVAVGKVTDGVGVWHSTNGVDWTPVPPDAIDGFAGRRMRGVAALGSTLVAVGFAGSDEGGPTTPVAWRSTNHGETWTLAHTQPASDGTGKAATVTAFGDGFVAVGSDTAGGATEAAVWTSEDGTRWERASGPDLAASGTNRSMNDVVADGDRLLAGGTNGGKAAVWASSDGRTWALARDVSAFAPSSGDTLQVSGLAVNGGAVIAVGTSTVGGDPDAMSWRSEGS